LRRSCSIFVALCCCSIFLPVVCGQSVVARWDFGTEEPAPVTMHGEVAKDIPGPRPPEFPDFAEDNTAIKLNGSGYLSIADPGTASDFDFANGDSIALEAWVRLDSPRDGQLMYVIGKGRTNSPRFARDNQNWALRVISSKGTARLSFLFATPPAPGQQHWHRWTSQTGFPVETGWHHIAVSYTFGEPQSIIGWIDGRPTKGDWDMGGATESTPVVDDDDIWIGSSLGGSSSNSFRGSLDSIAIHRAPLTQDYVTAQFNRVGGPQVVEPQPAVMPDVKGVPNNGVVVTLSGGFPNDSRWPLTSEAWPEESARLQVPQFLLHRVPAHFDDWGIRSSWDAPVLVRMAGDVTLPVGEQEFLIRVRSLSRLWVDGVLVAQTPAARRRSGNLEPIVPIPVPPVADGRVVGFVQQETTGTYEVTPVAGEASRSCRVVFEFLVGGSGQRTESGEVCVALQDGDWYRLLSPDTRSALPLLNHTVATALAEIEHRVTIFEDFTRRTAAASMSPFWDQRHQIARDWVIENSPDHTRQSDVSSENIDALIRKKIHQASQAAAKHDAATTEHFHQKVLPVLRDQCFRCHGEKSRGGLRLNSRDNVLKSGDSEIPAVVPGDPDRSEMVARIRAGDMPPTEEGLASEDVALLEEWIRSGAPWPAQAPPEHLTRLAPVIDDAAFIRRASLDTTGTLPSAAEVTAFLSNSDDRRRERLVDRLLADPGLADHWVSFWMDLLAENPTLLNQSLNSTGPFRWFLYDALRDGKAIDRMVTELILLRGSPHEGGSAGFGLAAENDAPMAAKAHILASAFLGVEMQCARCHDSPYHSTTQADLYATAAMLNRKPLAPPRTSRVPDAFFESKGRESLIQVSLPLGTAVTPAWPFAAVTGVSDDDEIRKLMLDPDDSRERLAALITSPGNQRFAQVIVNHLWKRLMGAGLVEPVDDWEGHPPSHPEILNYLARELIIHDYDVRHILRLIMNSRAYQGEAIGQNLEAPPDKRFFNAPDARRMTAEQVVDSLFMAAGQSIDVEELTFVHDGSHAIGKRLTLGKPRRAWMFASLNNERDRPSLSLPRAQPIVDVLEAFGWSGSRQMPIAVRESDPNVLQPGILANGTLTQTLTRASAGSALAELALEATEPSALLDQLFLRFLSRLPTDAETARFLPALSAGFQSRVVNGDIASSLPVEPALPQVTWTNHLVPEANEIQLDWQKRVLRGPPPDNRLQPDWREVYEDIVWSLVNHRDFVWIP